MELVIGKQYRVNTKNGQDEYYTRKGLFITKSMIKLHGTTVTVSKCTGSFYKVEENDRSWNEEVLEELEATMTKDEWLIAIINGAGGTIEGADRTRYTYDSKHHIFYKNGSVCNINAVDSKHTLTIGNSADEMTLEEVCKELGRDIKIVQKGN